MKTLREIDPAIWEAIHKEKERQHTHIELIASENFVSRAVLEAQGSVLTNKYAEGYPGKRWYHGCAYIDDVERLAIDRAKKLFGAEHANVQPHSGSQANMAVYFTMLKPGDTVLAMDLSHGGHLTHGHHLNFSGRFFNIVSYGVNRDTEMLDYNHIAELARQHTPKMIIAGASAYPRIIDASRFRAIADEVGACLMVDMAHFAGLVAAGCHPSPVPYAEFVTTTTHKTLRGPRGGMILCKEQFKSAVDSHIFPGIQGGPLMHVIAAKAVCFHEALSPDFVLYQKQIMVNAKILAESLYTRGYRIVSGGTDNHLMLVDLRPKNTTGREAADALDKAGITVNKNLIPFDSANAMVTSGIRLGTPAVTTRGMKEPEMQLIAELIDEAIKHKGNDTMLQSIKSRVFQLTHKFPLYQDV